MQISDIVPSLVYMTVRVTQRILSRNTKTQPTKGKTEILPKKSKVSNVQCQREGVKRLAGQSPVRMPTRLILSS